MNIDPALVVLGLFAASFIVIVVLFVRKTQKRRQEMFGDAAFLEEEHTAELGEEQVFEPINKPVSKPPKPTEDSPAQPIPATALLSDDELTLAMPQGEGKGEPHSATALKQPEQDQALRDGMQNASRSFFGRIGKLWESSSKIDDSMLEELEEILLTADVGVKLTMHLLDQLRDRVKNKKGDKSQVIGSQKQLLAALKEMVEQVLLSTQVAESGLEKTADGTPKVLLFVGVNGVGKTTTIGKIASKLVGENHSVMLAAGDTFRAAAVEQLTIWGERTNSKVVRGEDNADPASVIFKAVTQAKQNKTDYLLADTSGRLHTNDELMAEIEKIKRVAGKALPNAPHETWIVVDGTTGQNALLQAEQFNKRLGLTGVVLTKLDGTAKGGVVLAIAHGLKLPIRFVGVGEQAEHLRPFHAATFVDALFQSA